MPFGSADRLSQLKESRALSTARLPSSPAASTASAAPLPFCLAATGCAVAIMASRSPDEQPAGEDDRKRVVRSIAGLASLGMLIGNTGRRYRPVPGANAT